MKLIKVLKDSDFGLEDGDVSSYKLRRAARTVLIDEMQRVGMIHAENYNYYKLPGGGIEPGESIWHALVRETREEVGWEVEGLTELGAVREERKAFNQINLSYGFLCRTMRFVGTNLMEDEEEAGFKLEWFDNIDEAIICLEKVGKRPSNSYRVIFFTARELVFLKRAKDILARSKK